MEPFYLFITPPSFSDLAKRLQGRNTETPEAISSRLAMAKKELKFAQEPGVYDAVLVNDDLDRAYKVFEKICLGESDEGDGMPNLEIPDESEQEKVAGPAINGTAKKATV